MLDQPARREIVERVCCLMGCEFQSSITITEERLGQDAAYVIDSARAREEFGWKPKVQLEHGLSAVVEWIQANWEQVQREPLEYEHRE